MPPITKLMTRSLPIGAEPAAGAAGVHFRVWAPEKKQVSVVFRHGIPDVPLEREPGGYFAGTAPTAKAGDQYKYSVDQEGEYPDPASRFQPEGPHQWSQIVDPGTFTWTDSTWKGVKLRGQVIYELHLGTFTTAGTWRAAADKLAYLRDTGITVLEIMPVADFPGKFGWGYDGVQLYAPVSIYGTPDDMRHFVDQAHNLNLAVILDVVYNHIGPDGNYLPKFSPYYFSDKHTTDWGAGINYDGPHCAPVREFILNNAVYWIREFHLDGLRLDATQDIHDDSGTHIISEISSATRAAAEGRGILLIAENEPQETHLIRPQTEGGYGLDGMWNDDYHHSATVALTGKADAYYTDYRGTAQEFVSTAKHGYLYQGQWYRWQKKRRGTPTFGTPREAMVTFIQNHDQIANSGWGQRAHEQTSPGRLKAVTAFTLLGPGTPMLFQGQEFASSSRFLFFADHNPELSKTFAQGRVEFLAQWRSLKLPEMQSCMRDPADQDTFETCKLDFTEVEKHASVYALHRDLLRLRREDAVISRQGADGIDGAVLAEHAFAVRFFSPDYSEDRLLVINLDADLHLDPAPVPLLAPPLDKKWVTLWSTDEPQYGGCGTPALDSEENWRIPAESAVVLRPAPNDRQPEPPKTKKK